jgi:hypothetical protein
MNAGRRQGLSAAAAIALLPIALLPIAAPPAGAQAVGSALAVTALTRFAAACDAEGRALWGRPLCGPVVLVHAPSRAAISNAPDPDGDFQRRGDFWFGELPAALPTANTSVHWGDAAWAMVLLPLPRDEFAYLSLIAHEAFHRIQPDLGLGARDAQNPHLDEQEARVWFRLELRALAAALRSPSGGTAEIRDALAFRARRHRIFPGADTLEAQLERHEGLAEYTGIVFAQRATAAGLEPVLQLLHDFERRRSFVRSLGYGTGPALGLLLDRHAPGWRAHAARRPLHELLAEAVGFTGRAIDAAVGAVIDADVRALAYGYPELRAEEAARAAEATARLADIRQRVMDGPVLLLAQADLRASFNPGELVPVADAGTYYPTGTFQAAWGTLVVTRGGALLSPDWQRLRVPLHGARRTGPIVEGDGWRLELADGWTTVAVPGGDWRAARSK